MSRRRPYTQAQLDKSPCHVCGEPARFQWSACADGNIWRPLCESCDVDINIAVLKILDPTNWKVKLVSYCKSIGFKLKRNKMS